jgi:uncharacterized protein YndB with AHSA1/START domain
VWRSLAHIQQFCKWFGAEPIDPAATFEPGAHVRFISTHPGACYRMQFSMDIVNVVPESQFSWKWHPGIVQPGEDVSAEPMTLVEFRLEDAEGGTRLYLNESGFDALFASRSARVFGENQDGWKIQLESLERFCSENE